MQSSTPPRKPSTSLTSSPASLKRKAISANPATLPAVCSCPPFTKKEWLTLQLKMEKMEAQNVLMAEGEIEEALLSRLMQEVAAEANEKAAVAKKQMQQRIAREIQKAETRYKAKHT